MSRIKELVSEIKTNEVLRKEFIKSPLEFLEIEAKKNHPIFNNRIFMNVVLIVGSALLLSIILASLMIFLKDDPVDDFFIMIASASIGALAGLLVPTPSNQ